MIDIVRNAAKNLLFGALEQLPKSRNSKKVQTTFEKVTLIKEHILCPSLSKFVIFHHFKLVLSMLAQSVIFSEASKIYSELLNVNISNIQIERGSKYYVELRHSIVENDLEEFIPKL